MKKSEIKTFVTELLDGNEVPTGLFDTMLDVAQMYWENRRPWVVLRSEDTTGSISASNTYETEHDLPTKFRKWYTRYPIVLTDSAGNAQQYLAEVPINMKGMHKSDNSRFYCDYKNKKLYICGNPGQSLTIRQYFIEKTTKISDDDNNEWDLDPNDEYTQILGLTIAVHYKRGTDYDIINNKQADGHAALALQIFNSMEEWDGELAESALNGQTYGGAPGRHFGADGNSGSIHLLG